MTSIFHILFYFRKVCWLNLFSHILYHFKKYLLVKFIIETAETDYVSGINPLKTC